MKICYENPLLELKKIVNTKAKYQKVLLIYDELFSNIEINEIYQSVKGICVYNQQDIHGLDLNEIYNGYRLIIFCCSVDNFLKYSFDRSEFINVYYAKEGSFLPFFLNNVNKPEGKEDYCLVGTKNIDLSSIASIYFNNFYNYLINLICGDNYLEFSFKTKEITQKNIFAIINNLNNDMFFLDIDILKKQNIEYNDLIFVDIIILDAFLLFFESVKNNRLMLVDVYKSAKNNFENVEKFYKLYNNNSFINLIVLNYNCLYNYCKMIKEKIKELIKFFNINYLKTEKLFNKLKLYSKNDNQLMSYLYLYNIFGV